MSKERIELGDIAKETVTGFTGIVVARTIWLSNCDQLTIQPQGLDKEGKPHQTRTFDEPRVVFVKKGKVPTVPCGPPNCEVGDEVRDGLTGLVGIVTQVSIWNEGCIIVSVQPQGLKDGQPLPSASFDDRKLVVTKKAKVKLEPKPSPVPAKTGGPRAEPARGRGQ